jgi:hypothetical protein
MNTTPSTYAINPHAIKFPDGQFYSGPDWVGTPHDGVQRIDNPGNRGPITSAFAYTESRAYDVIATEPRIFRDCTVVPIC